jgi:hypothetical protein
MSIFTVVFPGQAGNTAMPTLVDSLVLSMLGFGLLGIFLTLLAVWKARRGGSTNVSAKIIRA